MDEFVIYHVPREENIRANALAQQSSGYNVRKRNFQEHKLLLTAECFALEAQVRPTQPTGLTGDNGLTDVTNRSDQSHRSGSVHGTGLTDAHDQSDRSPSKDSSSVFRDENEVDDWRKPLVDYLHNPSSSDDRKVRALKFVLDDGELYHRTADDLLLKCLGPDQARLAMEEVHEGICGTHQSAPKMKWLLRQACFYWPTMIADCFRYYKGCEECQKHGDVQLVPIALMHPIIKSWPFRGWGLDFIGKIHPSSSKGHCFVIVATDYFTK
jgi:hypothetical protein